MSNFNLRLHTAFILSLFSLSIFAQRAGLQVNRTSAIDRALPVLNVAVDANGRKWAANRNGVFQVKAADFSTQRTLQAGQQNVLSFHGGNADAAWSQAEFQKLVETACTITAAWYDESTSQLWIGTDEAGLFQFKNGPQLQLMQKYTTANTKLKSNHITVIFQDKLNRLWVGTDKGVMYGAPGRWKADLQGYEIQRVRQFGSDVYVLADGTISKAANGEKWTDLGLDTKKIEGDIVDFDIAADGKLWALSGWLTRYDLLGDTYDVFAGPENYTSQNGVNLAIDADGAVWVGTGDKGLFLVDKASAITVNAYVDQPISCTGNGKDATLAVKVTGGDAPYQYIWSGGLSGATPTGVAPGTYQLTVTDSKNKSRTAEVSVPDARLRISARQKKAVSAAGKTDGTAEVDIASNASGLQIRWDNGETMAVATGLAAGPHTVTVTDPKGCVATANVTIADKALPLTAAITEKTRINCNGDKTGTLGVQVNGGKAPFQYAWNLPAARGEAPGSLPAGDYYVTVTDAAGTTALANISLRQPEPLTATAVANGPAATGAADGKATVTPKGGTGVYTYKWDNGETLAAATKLAPGQHTVVIADANGCTTRAAVTIAEQIQPLAITLTEKGKINCSGGKTAAISVQVSGGKTPLQYAWNNPALQGDAPSGLAAGEYRLTVTDAAGTTSTAAISLKQPDPVTATTNVTAPAATGQTNGQASVQAAGGTGAYTYKWDNGETAATATRLAPGNRSVTVTDANGCSASATIAITENILPLTVTISEKTNIKCSGEKNGGLATQVSGGKGPYKYTWDNPALKGESPANLAAGKYLLTVTDATGATSTALFTLEQPDGISAWAVAQAPASTGNPDGKATAQAKGGANGFKFLWDTGETGELASKLAAGIHTVTVTDANGCTASARVTIVENILPLAVTVEEKNKINCHGGKTASLAAQVNGGKGPFKYTWSNASAKGEAPANLAAGDYTLTVSDATGKTATATLTVRQPDAVSASATVTAPASTGNTDGQALVEAKGGTGTYIYKWDNGETAAAATRLGPGTRSVTATDANGCSATATVAISENILPLGVAITEKLRIGCPGEKATLSTKVNGGKGPFKYAWNLPVAKGETPSDLPAGDYVLTVTDATGKTATATFAVKSPEVLNAVATVTAPASTGNSDGKASVQAKGGTGEFRIKWDNGETTAAATRLAPGQHTVTVTDVNGCWATAGVAITENILPLTVNLGGKTKIDCAGEKAALDVEVSGGKPPYTFAWNNAGLHGARAADLEGGTYAVTVTDAQGASQTRQVVIAAPTALEVRLARNIGATSDKIADGKAVLSIQGGTPKYSIAWDTKQSGATAGKLALGRHAATVTDANGCTETVAFETKKRALPELTGKLESGQTIRMGLLNFSVDSSSLRPEMFPMLDELYDFMVENPGAEIEIAGHTNNLPADDFADKLSSARAKAVADYLFAKGVDPSRVMYKGYGKRLPLVPNTNEQGRRTNQRVEIKIVKIQ